MVAAKKADFEKWAKDLGIAPVVARIIRNREITEEEQARKFLYGSLADCYSPWLMRDMDKAVEAVQQAIRQGARIRVIGDYDVDGICAAYILKRGFSFLGAQVDAVIPHRIHDGYGLNDHLIETAQADGVELIVTCDNGIAAAKQVELANRLGMQVVVTDHHEVPYEVVQQANPDGDGEVRREILPPAVAVVDPKRVECTYPFKGICGGVVAFKLMQALTEGRDDAAGLREEFLEFAALSTVCDVMELVDENRILVREGLKRIQRGGNQGLRALLEVNALEPRAVSAYHLGFVIGPCLNATGRLDTAGRALELLCSETKAEAMRAAGELKELNDSRKNLTVRGVEEAEDYIERQRLSEDRVLVLFLPEVHESLAGIIAGRIREQYNKPVIVLTRGEEGVKGSGRSIETYSMYDELCKVKELFSKFGGHKMAAGLSLEERNIETLRRRLNENCGLTEDDLVPRIHIDVPMPIQYATEELAGQLEQLEPFGVGNPKPLFAQKNVRFLSASRMGAEGKCARLRAQAEDGSICQIVLFRDLEGFEALLAAKYGPDSVEKLYAGEGMYEISVTYQLQIHVYRGRREKQLIIQNFC